MPGFEVEFSVSSRGRVRRDVKARGTYVGRQLKPYLLGRGYLAVRTSRNSLTLLVHRLVCEAFHGPPPTDEHATNHKNGRKTDNDESNLEWMTYGENMRHAVATGLHRASRGEANGNVTLTETDVRALRLRVAEGHSQIAVAEVFGVSRVQVWRVVNRKSWAWVE
jgi:hypothetical protein